MELIASLSNASTFIFRRSIPKKALNSNSNGRFTAKVNAVNDPSLQAAINSASIRYQETHRPEPLFHDPYAGCLATSEDDLDTKLWSLQYSLATKFIDDKLLNTLNQNDELKQVVLLSDGMDTRPYRLSWPKSTVIFDVSPDAIFNTATEKLQCVGAKVPRGCLLRHVSSESNSIQQSLCAKGFNGNLPSIWAIQGLPAMSVSSFEEILVVVSSLVANGCFFVGELPASLAETEMGIQYGIRQCLEKLFLSNGFRVNTISLEEVARSLGTSLVPGKCDNVVFAAEQLRFSDDQMEIWRKEFQRIEEEADEEGFEEL